MIPSRSMPLVDPGEHKGAAIDGLHLWYLVLLPLAALLVAVGSGNDAGYTMYLFGWAPAFVYMFAVEGTYRISSNPRRALLVTGATPAEVAVHTTLYDDSIGVFLLEEAFVEVAGFALAFAVVGLLARRARGLDFSEIFLACLGVSFGAASLMAFAAPLARIYDGRPDWAYWYLGAELVSSAACYYALCVPSVVQRAGVEPTTLVRDGGWIGRFLGPRGVARVPSRAPGPGVVLLVLLLWLLVWPSFLLIGAVGEVSALLAPPLHPAFAAEFLTLLGPM